MNDPHRRARDITRRDFVEYTAAMAAVPLVPSMVPGALLRPQGGRPNSKFNGVQIGTITYSFREMPSTADDILSYLLQCGISSIELMGDPAEQFAGAPAFEGPAWPGPGRQFTAEQRAQFQAARQAYARELSEWRRSVPMSRFEALRRRYNDAGVNIHIVKFSDIGPAMSEAEVNYCFNVANALGAGAITTELADDKAIFLAPYAAEHQIKIAFHNHTQVNSSSWDLPMSRGEYLGINLDVAHYVAGANADPIPVIERWAETGRVVSLHIKDRRVNGGPNVPFGEGDTPVALILQLMKRNGYTFPADIELEYEVPEGSNPVAEVRKCVEFCRNALADAPASGDRM